MIDQELVKQVIEWALGAGVVITITIRLIIKFNSRHNKVVQKTKGDNSPNVNIGNIINSNKDDVQS